RLFLMLAIMAVTVVSVTGNNTQAFLDALYQAISLSITLVVLVRIGLFSSAVMFFTNMLLLRTPFTLDSASFYAGPGWVAIGGLMALACYGFRLARQPRVIAARSSLSLS